MREISLDTETTGLFFADGDRITEIGCVEIIDKKITGKNLHIYVNPERELSASATNISGLTHEFLKQFKKFEEIADEFLEFIGESRLVIHNAPFDIGFLNFELSKAGKKILDPQNVVDTLVLTREKFPGAQATLDALCRRFSIDASSRTKHGALIDAELLAEVYLHLSVEKLQKSIFGATDETTSAMSLDGFPEIDNQKRTIALRHFPPSDEELANHSNFLSKIKNPIWDKFLTEDQAKN